MELNYQESIRTNQIRKLETTNNRNLQALQPVMSNNEAVPQSITSLFGGSWAVEEFFSNGTNGKIYTARNIHTGVCVVAKHDTRSDGAKLQREATVYNVLSESAPEMFQGVHVRGIHDNGKVMIMGRLGPSLDTVMGAVNGPLPQDFVVNTGVQVLSILEKIHEKNILHRDIKPGHLLLGCPSSPSGSNLFLIDFSLSGPFLDKRSRHFRSQFSKRVNSSMEFGSISAHKGRNLSRRDDVESLIYTLVYLAKGCLPWSPTVQNNVKPAPTHEEIIACKQNVSPYALFSGMPPQFITLWEYFKTLRFNEAPDYAWMRGLLNSTLLLSE